jgi:hypothetical protein
MKKLTILLTFLLLLILCISQSFGQVATSTNTAAAINAQINTAAAIAATSKLTKYGVTQAQLNAIINGIPGYVAQQVALLKFGVAPVVSGYTYHAPITLNGVSGQTITLDSINGGGSVNAITLNNCSNIHIQTCKLYNCIYAVYEYNCVNVTVDGCFFNNVEKAVNAVQSINPIVSNSQCLNINTGSQTGNFVQFNNCKLGSVINNKVQNNPGMSSPEDVISIFESNGTTGSPIIVSGNQILGGGPSGSGGGIMAGDYGGSNIIVENNILVNPGQYGIACSGGQNIQLLNNKIFAVKNSWCNIGMYLYPQGGAACSTVTITGNQINYTNNNGVQNNFWNSNQCSGTVTVTGNTWGAPISATILPVNIVVYH